jgi:hypothetical protein
MNDTALAPSQYRRFTNRPTLTAVDVLPRANRGGHMSRTRRIGLSIIAVMTALVAGIAMTTPANAAQTPYYFFNSTIYCNERTNEVEIIVNGAATQGYAGTWVRIQQYVVQGTKGTWTEWSKAFQLGGPTPYTIWKRYDWAPDRTNPIRVATYMSHWTGRAWTTPVGEWAYPYMVGLGGSIYANGFCYT